MANAKAVLVHDWLTGRRGGARVLEILAEIFPKAPICTLFHFRRSHHPRISSMLAVVLLACLSTLYPVSAQEKLQESVVVTAVEIPVRVYDGKAFVTGLTRDDFEIYEDGIKQEITGFEAVSRAISPAEVERPESVQRAPRKRNFLLIFNVFDVTDQVADAIDFFFKNVFSPGDTLGIIVDEKPLEIKGDKGGEDIPGYLKTYLKELKKASRRDLMQSFMRLEKRAENFVLACRRDGTTDYNCDDIVETARRFFGDYRRAWDEYRKQRLSVNIELYKSLAARFGKLDGDKWAICFQQREVFPKFKHGGRLDQEMRTAFESQIGLDPRAALVEAQRAELERSFDVNTDFPGEKIRDLFTEANITFHVLLMKPVGLQGSFFSEDLEVREVRAEYENVLRSISRDTGGLAAFSNDVLETLREAAAKIDQYYLIVYQPKKGAAGPGHKIDVRVKKDNVNVVSLKERTPAKAAGIMIFGFERGPGTIAFQLKDYARAPLERGERGRATIKVTIFDDQSAKVFFRETTLDLTAETVRLSLELTALVPGDCFVVIEAYDIVSGEKAVFSQAVRLE